VKTEEQMMIADLQGVFIPDYINPDGQVKPLFKLTDPVVHNTNDRKGRTDRGEQGISDFFGTHVCNAVCRHLKLPACLPGGR